MRPRTDNKTMATTKTVVSRLTPRSHWLTSNPLIRKFLTKLSRLLWRNLKTML
ncbi:hypothetical protein HanHA300_Chr14g0515751 [Helianthus annuus]|nr:hypothetical protein HanHA300_Chr14g0515751 [Helianthus annuus]